MIMSVHRIRFVFNVAVSIRRKRITLNPKMANSSLAAPITGANVLHFYPVALENYLLMAYDCYQPEAMSRAELS